MSKPINWDPKKNTILKLERGVSFEMVTERISKNAYKVGPTTSKSHGKQKAFFMWMKNRAWVVPFKETKTEIFLITIMEDL